jgi:hypothetical protein
LEVDRAEMAAILDQALAISANFNGGRSLSTLSCMSDTARVNADDEAAVSTQQ